MATVGKVLGRNLRLYVDSTPSDPPTWVEIGCATSATLTLETEMLEEKCKDDGQWSNPMPDGSSWSISVEGLVIYSNPFNSKEFIELHKNQTKVLLRWTTGVTGDDELTGEAYLVNYSETAPVEGYATYSAEFQGIGEYEIATL